MKFTYGTGTPIHTSGLEKEYNDMKNVLSEAIKNNKSFSAEVSLIDEMKNPLIDIDYDNKKALLTVSYTGRDTEVNGFKEFINVDKGLAFIDKTFNDIFQLRKKYNQ